MAALAHEVFFGVTESMQPGIRRQRIRGLVLEAADTEKSGSDLTTLWTTPHPSGMSTMIQDTTITSSDDFLSERTMVVFSFGPG